MIIFSKSNYTLTRFWFTVLISIALLNGTTLASKYNQLDTTHFTFFYHAADRGIAEYLVRHAESTRREIMADLGIESGAKTRVYIAASRQEFQQLQPKSGKAPAWADALAYSGLKLIILHSPRANKGRPQDILTTFKHELTHIAVGQAFKGQKVPHWLNEGLAMYESREWKLDRISHMTRAVLTDSLIPLKELTRNFPLDPQQAILAYDQSFYLVSYLLTQKGAATFQLFIREYSKGHDLEKVTRALYGLDLEELEQEWHKHLRFRFSWLPLIFSTTTLWFVITLIFLTSYWKKKRANRLTVTDWEEEEAGDGG
jgi:hypothetical protein